MKASIQLRWLITRALFKFWLAGMISPIQLAKDIKRMYSELIEVGK